MGYEFHEGMGMGMEKLSSGDLPLYTRGGMCPDLVIMVNNGWPVGRVECVKRLCLREERNFCPLQGKVSSKTRCEK